MKKLFFASLVALSSFNLASAEYIYGQYVTAVGDKAYTLSSTSTAQTLTQYSFPQLTELKTLELSNDTYPTVQAYESGVTVTTYAFAESISSPDEALSKVKASVKNKIRESGDDQVVVFTETITTKSYDTNLTEVGTLITSNSYTYTFVDPKEVSEDEVASGAVDIKKSSKKCKNPTRKKDGKVCAKVTL
jgi:hypothetical protein